jgi:hypothetical protein
MPSHKANRWGTKAEYHMAEQYDLELKRESWRDAVKNGTPWELKATKRTHADGQPGNFKIYKQYHERLQAENGRYGFAVYRIRGKGAQILETATLPASRLPTVRWHGGGDHRDTEQAKVSISDVF